MAKFVVHIADIHIHERNYAHIRYSWKNVLNDIKNIPNYKLEVVLVIAGDIFDHKTYLTAGDVSIFYEMMTNLERDEIKTIMIPGNHDYNNNNSKGDKIHALVERSKYKHVVYQSSSGIVNVSGLLFFVHSPIDLQVPRPKSEHVGTKTIALVHEPFSESRTCSGITFGKQRFAASDFTNIFDMTMLGDIHMPQMLARNVAYSGSFVQKNKGEGLKHGYMLWDVEKSVPTFIEMAQLSLHLKLWANDNKMGELPDVIARSISLYHTDCNNDMIVKFRNEIETKYDCRIAGVFDKTTLKLSDVKVPTKQELSETVSLKLADMKLDNEQYGRIVKMHRNMFNETTQEISTDWRIRFLSWSNVYCYGKDNFINFDEIGNLTSLIGPNKVGKSSVIDILMLVLFNQTTRGSKRNALNVNSNSGYIKCVITVADDEYAIERAWIDRKTVAVRVYKNGDNITNEDLVSTYTLIGSIIGSKRVFINSTAALQHRQFLVDLGSKEIYELVCRMMELDRLRDVEDQNSAELRSIKKQVKLMQSKMGNVRGSQQELDDTRAALENFHRCADAINVKISKVHERRAIVSVDVDEKCIPSSVLDAKINTLKQFNIWDDTRLIEFQEEDKKLTQRVEEYQRLMTHISDRASVLKSELKEIHCDMPIATIATKITAAENIDIIPIIKKMSDIKSSISSVNIQIHSLKKQQYDVDVLIVSHKLAINKSVKSVEDIERALKECGEHVDTKELLASVDSTKEKSQEINNLIIQTRAEKCHFKCFVYAKPSQCEITSMRNLDIDVEEKTLHESLKNTKDDVCVKKLELRSLEKHLRSKEDIVSKFDASSATSKCMKWNNNCDCCTHNASTLNIPTDYNSIKTDIHECFNKCQQLIEAISILDKSIISMDRRIENIRSFRIFIINENENMFSIQYKASIQRVDNLTSQLNVITSNNKNIDQMRIDLILAKQNKITTSKIKYSIDAKKQLMINIETLMSQIKQYERDYVDAEKLIILAQDSHKLLEQYASHIHNEKINSQLSRLNIDINDINMNLRKHRTYIDNTRSEIRKMIIHRDGNIVYNETVALFNASQDSEYASDELRDLNVELSKLIHQNTIVCSDISTATFSVGRLEQIVKTSQIEEKELSNIMQDQSDRTIYDKIINHKTGVPELMMKTMCVNIQSHCNEILKEIADFQVGIVFDKEISINTVTENSVIAAEQSSGYQKFIVDLIMRQVLCSLTLAAHPRILFVDEGFGSLDKDNFEIVCKTVLPNLASHFEKVVIISHNPSIHKHTTTNCEIKQANGRSQLQFGQIAHNGINLRVQDDHQQYMKNTREKKDEANAINATDKENKRQTRRVVKIEEERYLLQHAMDKQADYGESIVEAIDDKMVRCMACNKEYKNRNGFAASHIKTKAHMKCMQTYS